MIRVFRLVFHPRSIQARSAWSSKTEHGPRWPMADAELWTVGPRWCAHGGNHQGGLPPEVGDRCVANGCARIIHLATGPKCGICFRTQTISYRTTGHPPRTDSKHNHDLYASAFPRAHHFRPISKFICDFTPSDFESFRVHLNSTFAPPLHHSLHPPRWR